MAQSEASQNRMDALAVVALAASSLVVTFGGYVINEHGTRLDKKDARISTLEVEFARVVEHAGSHDQTAAHWIRQIIESTKLLRAAERRLDRLETRPSARPDPFTGADGKRLELMLRELQKRYDNMRIPQGKQVN